MTEDAPAASRSRPQTWGGGSGSCRISIVFEWISVGLAVPRLICNGRGNLSDPPLSGPCLSVNARMFVTLSLSPSVSLSHSISFMQHWIHEGLPACCCSRVAWIEAYRCKEWTGWLLWLLYVSPLHPFLSAGAPRGLRTGWYVLSVWGGHHEAEDWLVRTLSLGGPPGGRGTGWYVLSVWGATRGPWDWLGCRTRRTAPLALCYLLFKAVFYLAGQGLFVLDISYTTACLYFMDFWCLL